MEAPTVATTRPAYKDIAYGSVAGMVSKLFEMPFDMVKVRLQSQPTDRPPRFDGPVDCFRQTLKNEGVRGLYRGLSMPVLGAMAENATLFVVYSQTQSLLRRYWPASPTSSGENTLHGLPLPQIAFAGGCAGAVTSFVLTPIELVKVRMQVQMIAQEQHQHILSAASASHSSNITSTRPKVPGPVKLFRSVLQQHGVRGLWLGQTGTFLREAGGSVAWFAAFEGCARAFVARRQKQLSPSSSRRITKDDLNSAELMLAGAAAGAGYTVVLFPADCIKSTIQSGDELAKGRKQAGFLEVGKEIYRARGIKGLYSGCGVTIVRSAPSSAIIFWLYSLMERQFG